MNISRAYRVDDGTGFSLKRHDPSDTGPWKKADKRRVKALQSKGLETLEELQDKLYAQDRWSILLIFQAMDAAGKDGVIKHVMSGVNPQGCEVYSFKTPSSEEIDHDFMWRTGKRLPERGRIGVFNRSYYEEVLIVRVHPEILATQHLPPRLVTRRIWEERYEDIRAFERYLTRNGTVVLKFFLNVSKAEQKRRFLERIERSEKNWKFAASDVAEREHWPAYMKAYDEMIRRTATSYAPWYVVPADNKWFTRAVVTEAVVDALQGLDLAYPRLAKEKRVELEAARTALESE